MAARSHVIVEERAPTPTVALAGVRSRGPDPWGHALLGVLRLLGVAAITEVVLMRTFYRVGVFVPRRGVFPVAYRSLTTLGSFALNLSSVLVLVGLALLGVRGLRRDGRTAAGWALAGFVGVSMLLSLTHERSIGPTARIAFVLAVLAVTAPFIRGRAPWSERLPVGTVVGVCLLSSYAALVRDTGVTPASASTPVGAELAAEALTIVAAFALLGGWIRRGSIRPGVVAAGALAAGGVLVLWWANGSVMGILALWTVGLRLYLPVWVYAAAAAAFAVAVVGWRRSAPWRSVGLVLLFAGGVQLGSTYAASLVLAGVVLLTDAAAVGGMPRYSSSSGISSRRLATNVASSSSMAGSSPGSS